MGLLLRLPRVKSMTYGSSVPATEAADQLAFSVVRLPATEEDAIPDMAKNSVAEQGKDEVQPRMLTAYSKRGSIACSAANCSTPTSCMRSLYRRQRSCRPAW